MKISSTPPARTASARPSAMRAAPLATAKSPATVAWLSVMDGALAPTAMATTAAMLFITVFGKIIGESPDGQPHPRPALEPRLARGQTAGGERHAADARQAPHLGPIEMRHEPGVVDLGSKPALPLLHGKGLQGGDGLGRTRQRGSDR